MSDALPGLAALCQSIRARDTEQSARDRAQFVAQNWPLIVAIDRLADAEFAAGAFSAACRKLELIETLLPQATGFFLRRISAGVRAGEPGLLEELAGAAGRLGNDGEMFHAVEELVASGRPDLAAQVIAACTGRDGFSAGMLAAAQSRILSTTGRLAEAIALLSRVIEEGNPPVLVLRLCYLAMEHALDFAGARRVLEQALLMWGEERELRHAVERLCFTFDFDAADALLRAAAARHPARAELAAALQAQTGAARDAARQAAAACGMVEGADPADIYDALSKPGTAAARVLWGKQALVSLLRSERWTAADYGRFAWYLPNWEDGLIRNHILASAQARFKDAPAVRAGWLHHLITQNIFADAAQFCSVLLDGAVDEDALFSIIALLRLQRDGMVHSFMEPPLFESLRSRVLERMAGTGPAFRCVMHDHIVALGGAAAGWPEDAVPRPGTPDERGLRRLFAITTGRLSRTPAGGPSLAHTAPVRPVLAISGQLRGFETTWPSIEAHLCRPCGAPVIVSVWDKSVNATGRHARRLERALPDDIVERLKPEERYTDAFEQAYPETFRLLFGQTAVDAGPIRAMLDQSGHRIIAVETESEAMIGQLLPPHISPNMLKMYYKFARLEALIQDAESRTGDLFSHVIWSRPDCDIQRLAPADLLGCLARPEVAWSSFVTENTFGDYVMVLPRRAFAALAGIFPRVVTAGDTRLLPWRPNRSADPSQPSNLDAFGGPDVIFDVLLGAGYMPLGRIPRMVLRLVGRTPGAETVRQVFDAEARRAPG